MRYSLTVTILALLLVHASNGVSKSAVDMKSVRGPVKRAADPHGHESEASSTCPVTEDSLIHEFNELAEELSLIGPDGQPCMVEEHGHEDDNDTDHHDDDDDDHVAPGSSLNLTCESTFEFVEQLLMHLNLVTDCCLVNGTPCETPGSGIPRPTAAQAYGYGFLLVIIVSACSVLGVFFVPFIKKDTKAGQLYKYIYSLMIALGASALFCDAILHLIPEAFGLHGHGEGEEEEGEEEDKTVIWKGVVIIAGTYFFFLFETILHTWNPHDHSHGLDSLSKKEGDESAIAVTNGLELADQTNSETNLVANGDKTGDTDICLETTVPHGPCKDTSADTVGGILHPGAGEGTEKTPLAPSSKNACMKIIHYIRNIKPLAWLIILGDAIHNFADGLALGAAIAQSLSLGLSTMIALIFHEIPHELGDFVILMSTGMPWYIALLFNLFSSLTAIVGFFIGVAISTNSEDANGWILAVAAGVFLYIALVDLLPELIHSKEVGSSRWCLFLMANIGLLISFVALLLLAIYEDQLNTLISL